MERPLSVNRRLQPHVATTWQNSLKLARTLHGELVGHLAPPVDLRSSEPSIRRCAAQTMSCRKRSAPGISSQPFAYSSRRTEYKARGELMNGQKLKLWFCHRESSSCGLW